MSGRKKPFAYREFPKPFGAVIRVTGWFGVAETHVLVVGRTPHRFTIQAIERTRLAGNYNWLEPGKQRRVPLSTVIEIDGEPVETHENNEESESQEESNGIAKE